MSNMKEFLLELVAHTHALGVLPIIRVTATPEKTYIDAVAEDKSMIFNATTHEPIADLEGVFGMSSLNKLDLHLKCPEYESGLISIKTDIRNNETMPVAIHFENANGDFQNDYSLVPRFVADMKLKDVGFFGTHWDIEFNPSQLSIQKLKYQIAAHTEEATFKISTHNNNIVISFGDQSTHAGSFIFHPSVDKSLKNNWAWPKTRIMSVLNLEGEKTIKLLDAGALQITIDSGICVYNYIFKGIKG